LLSIIGDKKTFEIEKSSDIDELFKNLKIFKILDNKVILTSKLHEKIIESNVSISSIYNIENNSDVNNNDNIYSFGENPLDTNKNTIINNSNVTNNTSTAPTSIPSSRYTSQNPRDMGFAATHP
jgi:hypothetical protein